MRILHTSDWHIGRRFKGVDLAEYQRRALEWLVDVVRREHIDVVCVSGDVYDSPMPSAASVDILDAALTRLSSIVDDAGKPAVDVIVTPGNHDSARKLGFGAHMMRDNVHLRCSIGDIATPVVVTRPRAASPTAADDASGKKGAGEKRGSAAVETLAVYAVPYLDPDIARPTLRAMLEDDASIPRSHAGVMGAAMSLIRADIARRRASNPRMKAVMMAHAFVSGANPSDSERNIAVGGVDGVPAAMFAGSGLDYLALGHLHRAQRVTVPQDGRDDGDAVDGSVSVDGSGPDEGLRVDEGMNAGGEGRTPIARYSGSLLAYSFSEGCVPPREGNGKSVVIVDMPEDSREPSIRTLNVESGQPPLVQLRGTPDELLGSLAERHARDWVSATVVCDAYPHGMYQKIDAVYDHALEKRFDIRRRPQAAGGRAMANLHEAHSEIDVLKDFVRYTLHRDPTADETAVLRQAVERTLDEAGDGPAKDSTRKDSTRKTAAGKPAGKGRG
ncbi:exonuclease subunit SbcD [Bifidobacterium sp. SMB2]|uniref:Nuclease SbcCD subunit D n=1 Tax=Bifidobacterium saimiriisciurei TaxID=2661627 RepID=A0ABX0CDF1_9BIFI|nr:MULTISPECIES: exonuclease SbcCD subunit D [Bifidobacterium]NEG96233.1 exonuclease subunit SbcD [Bifidobacterium sp. SMB2]NEH12246.1 exonuclease subunit SbcD [Bifidobacterium saimiriisciurei]